MFYRVLAEIQKNIFLKTHLIDVVVLAIQRMNSMQLSKNLPMKHFTPDYSFKAMHCGCVSLIFAQEKVPCSQNQAQHALFGSHLKQGQVYLICCGCDCDPIK